VSPIQKDIDRFIILFTLIAGGMGLITFGVNFAYGRDVITNLIFCIGIIVANVPEGILITVTVCMALAA
jgi:sodium/potassium-transporting ATPase subunit alpha